MPTGDIATIGILLTLLTIALKSVRDWHHDYQQSKNHSDPDADLHALVTVLEQHTEQDGKAHEVQVEVLREIAKGMTKLLERIPRNLSS